MQQVVIDVFDEVEEYLQDRVERGFTVIQAYVLRWLNIPNLDGELTLLDGDPSTPNEAYFKNVDFVVNRANELGLVMALVTSWGEHVKQLMTREQVFTTENAHAFGRYLGNRYRRNAVMWLLGGDRVPEEGKDVWCSMAKGLKEGSRNTHPVSYHGPGNPETPSSSYWFHAESWLDFNTIQSGHGWTIPNHDFISHDYHLLPVKPSLDIEAHYENHPDVRCKTNKRINGHQVREAAYWALLAGAAGHGYGCNDIWQFFDEARTPYLNDRTHPNNYPNTHWRKAMGFEGACSMKWLHRLFRLCPWYQLVPDRSLLADAVHDGENYTQVARAED